MKSLRARWLPWAVVLVFGCLPGFIGVGCTAAPSSGGTTKRDGGSGAPDFAGNSSENCGLLSQACCSNATCDTGLQCNPKTGGCCGAGGNTCKAPADCCLGLSCTGGKCCTASGAACGTSGDCCAGLTCSGKICGKPAGACGDIGKPCCSPDNTCTSGNTCVVDTCKACGQAGQICCDNMTCGKNLTCTNGTCDKPCGDTNQPCCKGADPCKTASLSCDMVSATCKTASGAMPGQLGQPCKTGNVCDNPLQCIAKTCQNPATCNTVGATCCSGGTCNATGLTCDTATNKCKMAATTCSDTQEICTTASQCCAPLTCVTTIQPDSTTPKTCCVGADAACPNGDLDCCGYLLCVSGKCTAGADGAPCLTGADCVSNTCSPGGACVSSESMCGGLKGLHNITCNASAECCNGALCLKEYFVQQCCYGQGAACDSPSDCCGAMTCSGSVNGTCVCRKVTESCDQNEDCCDAGICDNGKCKAATGTGGATVPPGGVCTDPLGLDCIDTNMTTYFCDGTNGASSTCCTYDLQIPCTSAAECCGTSHCEKNDFPYTTTRCCAPTGERCSVALDCCGWTSTCDMTTHTCK